MIRKARISDIREIQRLINFYAKDDLMLPRSFGDLYDNLRDFWVYEEKSKILGCCALHISWADLAEIKSLAIKKSFQKRGIGALLVDASLNEANQLGAKKIFVLTYKPNYFRRFGFKKISKEDLPRRIWTECINCPKFPDCKEIAMIKQL